MIESHVAFYLAVAFLLVAGNAFFVAAEFAFVKVRATRLEEMEKSGLPGSALAREVAARLDEYLSACQLGITMVSLGLGWIGEPAFATLLEPLFAGLGRLAAPAAHGTAIAVAFAIITVLHIVLGELVPKSLAIRKPGRVARISALPLKIFSRLFYPVLWLLNGAANGVLRLLGMGRMEEPGISENELRLLFADSIRRGVITPSEAEIMERATRFADRTARDVMVPLDRVVIWALNRPVEENIERARDVMVPLDRVVIWALDRPVEENIERARAAKHTRYPVVDARSGDLAGVINVKALALLSERDVERLREPDIIKELLRVPEDRRIDAVLREMRRRRLHMAAVVGAEGRAIGILTMEDIIEEIFGEIQDEFETGPAVVG